MPVMDGLTAIKAVRAMEASGELSIRSRVFALTGNARQGQIDYALQCGMDGLWRYFVSIVEPSLCADDRSLQMLS